MSSGNCVTPTLERLRAIVQAHSVRQTPDAPSLHQELLEVLQDLTRDARIPDAQESTAAETNAPLTEIEDEKSNRQSPNMEGGVQEDQPGSENRDSDHDAENDIESHQADEGQGEEEEDDDNIQSKITKPSTWFAFMSGAGKDTTNDDDDDDDVETNSPTLADDGKLERGHEAESDTPKDEEVDVNVNEVPPTLNPSRLVRFTSNCNGGVLPEVWLEDLKPHLEMLQQENVENTFPESMELSLREAQHLVLVVHGIGKHHDFKDASMSWDGSYGELSGGYYDFKSKFYEMLGPEGPLKDLPMNLNFESIEWHEPLREACNVEEVLKEAAPEGIASLREFVTEAITDGLLYWSSRYGQSIIDSVAWQLNEKYKSFKETHPGFTGPVSIFAHSLGSVIIFDLLSRCRTDIRTPKLDFDVNVFFLAGSPLAYMHLCRGDLFDENGTYLPSYFLPESVRVVNFFHVNDPVAWRLGPLLAKKKMEEEKIEAAEGGDPPPDDNQSVDEKRKAIRDEVEATGVTVTLPHSSEVEGLSLDDVLLKFADLLHLTHDDASYSSKIHLRPIDFGLPLSRYERVVELASATSAHSSYWGHPSLTLSVIMTLCEPLMPILQLYKERGVDVRVTPRRMKISFAHPALAVEPVMEEGPVKGFWAQRFCVLQDDGLFLFEKDVQESAGAKQCSIPLDRCQLRVKALKDHSSIMQVPSNSSSSSSSSTSIASIDSGASASPRNSDLPTAPTIRCPSEAFLLIVRDPNAKNAITYDITAKSQAIAQWWVDGIQQAQQDYLYNQSIIESMQSRPRRHSLSSILSGMHRPRNSSMSSAPESVRSTGGHSVASEPGLLHENNTDPSSVTARAATAAAFASSVSRSGEHKENSDLDTNGDDFPADGVYSDDGTLDEDEVDSDEEELDIQPPSEVFDLLRHGNLMVNVSTQWSGKSLKWFALRRGADSIVYFEREPKVEPVRQLDLKAVHLVQGSRMQRLLRLVYVGGGAMNLRFTRDGVFDSWHRLLGRLCPDARFEDLSMSHKSFLMPGMPFTSGEMAASTDTQLSVAVTGYVVCREPNSTSSYAGYTINVIFHSGDEGAHVVRRYSEFKNFSKEIAKEVESKFGAEALQKLPVLPSSTLLQSMQPSYLNRQVQKLHGYLCAMSKIKNVQGCSAWYAFLLRSGESLTSKPRPRTTSGTLPRTITPIIKSTQGSSRSDGFVPPSTDNEKENE